MSLESWRKEYYPIDADKIKSRDDVVLIEASLLKWIGLQKGNLAEHGLEMDEFERNRFYTPIVRFDINNESMDGVKQCALCTKYNRDDCEGCPLGSCGGFDRPNPYCDIYDNKYTNLTPLIEALAKALDKELNND